MPLVWARWLTSCAVVPTNDLKMQHFLLSARSAWRLCFLVLLLTTLYLSLVPVQHLPRALNFWDKAEHAIAFAALAMSGLLAYPGSRWPMVAGLTLLGLGIEVAQALSGWRQGDVMDWLADCVGLALGVLLLRFGQARLKPSY